jgi:ribonuclease D
VAALWHARDKIAARLDRAPGKILGDAAITELGAAPTADRSTIRQIPLFARRQARRFEAQWLEAIAAANELSESELPALHLPSDGPPQARLWLGKDPVAAQRLGRIREVLAAKAAELNVPVENLLTPEYVRRLAWNPPDPATVETVDSALAEMGARQWQRELTVELITASL